MRAKFNVTTVGRLTSLIMRNSWKSVEGGLTSLERRKLEALAMVGGGEEGGKEGGRDGREGGSSIVNVLKNKDYAVRQLTSCT